MQTRVISSEPWVPQRRERVFIVGFREDTDFDLDALELPSAEDGPKLGSILDRHEDVDPKYTLTPRLWGISARLQGKASGEG